MFCMSKTLLFSFKDIMSKGFDSLTFLHSLFANGLDGTITTYVLYNMEQSLFAID